MATGCSVAYFNIYKKLKYIVLSQQVYLFLPNTMNAH